MNEAIPLFAVAFLLLLIYLDQRGRGGLPALAV